MKQLCLWHANRSAILCSSKSSWFKASSTTIKHTSKRMT